MNDPGAARHRNRAIENFAAAGLDAFSRRLDVADVEIVEPERQRRLRIPHAANRLRSVGEELVRAHRVDMGARFLPAKQLVVKGERPFPVSGEQLMPAHVSRCARLSALLLGAFAPFDQNKGSICGSAMTEKRLMLGISVGGTRTVPPSCLTRPAAMSTSSTPTYPVHCGGTPVLFASAGSSISPATGVSPAANRL